MDSRDVAVITQLRHGEALLGPGTPSASPDAGPAGVVEQLSNSFDNAKLSLSCRDRHCPKCQSLARAQWLEARRAELLETESFHVVFTVPQEIAAIAYQNKRAIYNILFRATAETLHTIVAACEHGVTPTDGRRAS